MARETKQDRIVRGMVDQTIEHLHELKALESNPNSKETDLERWAQNVLRNCLGYMSSAGYQIRAQEAKGKMRPDLVVIKEDKPVFVVEVKRLGFDLGKSDFRSGKLQLNEYLNAIGSVRWGILTNGYEWHLYDFSMPQNGGIEVFGVDFRLEGDSVETGKKFAEELCYEVFDLHESSLNSKTWEQLAVEALAFSPESLSRAILSTDVVKSVSRSIRGEHDYKANLEILSDRIFDLLEKGLNDSIPGWNETKHAEFQKYIKSQKRAARRSRRTSNKVADSMSAITESQTVVVENDQARAEGQKKDSA